ncbi:hypothetical protein [Endozoicomonas euniceicola]|uniref:DUF4136 domain-containing protein n=1 Tax=Endozoicomonas euniceicola TaxID=1234143 RepID=A0ABY6GMJ0_9GAMM|nr:hypothetical protein [Endozoicomonas euniceicola]UYM13949.1 hypothetical protein NX720_13590 [Endozoicomonas euniceicola]
MNKSTFLLLACLTALPARGAAILKPEGKPTSFVRLMKEDSGKRVSGQELQAYLNSLLRANAIYDRNAPDEQPSLYFSVKANQAGNLVVTRKLTQANRIVMENNTLKVYGIGYSLQSDCSRQEQRCWVLFPNQKTRWMEINYAPKAVKELATGIGLLIREMQQ